MSIGIQRLWAYGSRRRPTREALTAVFAAGDDRYSVTDQAPGNCRGRGDRAGGGRARPHPATRRIATDVSLDAHSEISASKLEQGHGNRRRRLRER